MEEKSPKVDLSVYEKRARAADKQVRELLARVEELEKIASGMGKKSDTTTPSESAPPKDDEKTKTKKEGKSKKQPKWHKPSEESLQENDLKILNSLTLSVDKFIPIHKNTIKWYICGPTVYDSSHFGHARNYVTFDIIRRILQDYFGYNIFVVMNITDVDDKIIVKARQRHLIAEWIRKDHPVLNEKALAYVIEAYDKSYIPGLEKKVAKLAAQEEKTKEKNKKKELKLQKELYQERLVKAPAKKKLLEEFSADGSIEMADVLAQDGVHSEALGGYLDSLFGEDVTDHAIFHAHSNKYEREFLADMQDLGVLPPDVLTRVSEYVPEIVEMVQKIVKNGYGYVSNGSIYFDTEAFGQAQGHAYPKLEPWSKGDIEAIEDGEGGLTKKQEKKRKNDFALWKNSNPGEPWWNFPDVGKGRPGWHIECSAMAGNILGQQMDIHAGGSDLRFPHHDNEMAQAEAYFECKQWVNYHMHSGHLHIDGLKMSKSLKNFKTIRQIRENMSPRQIRLYFAQKQIWYRIMDYTQGGLLEIQTKETTILRFLETVALINGLEAAENYVDQKWNERDSALRAQLQVHQDEIHQALLNNFDTPTACNSLFKLINASNEYINASDLAGDAKSTNRVKGLLLRSIGKYVAKIFGTFGIEFPEYGFGKGAVESDDVMIENIAAIKDYAELAKIAREKVREVLMKKSKQNVSGNLKGVLNQLEELQQGNTGKSNASVNKMAEAITTFTKDAIAAENDTSALWKLSDLFRDQVLPALGIRLEDGSGVKYTWSYVHPHFLVTELEERRMAEERFRREQLVGNVKKEVEKLKTQLVNDKSLENVTVEDYFKMTMGDKYSKYDESGLPTHNENGDPLGKRVLKKVAAARKKYASKRSTLEKNLAKDKLYLVKKERAIQAKTYYKKLLKGKIEIEYTGAIGKDVTIDIKGPEGEEEEEDELDLYIEGPKKIRAKSVDGKVVVVGTKDGAASLTVYRGEKYVGTYGISLSRY